MDLLVVGLNHRSAPVELREKLAFKADALPGALSRLRASGVIKEAVILSTCNRVEVIASSPSPEAAELVSRALHAEHGLPAGTLDAHLFAHSGGDALRHLFRVASSLDAIVVGEPQILGQVKDAFQNAVEAGSVGALLSRVFHRAFNVAKRVRTETAIAQSAVSVSFAAVELARTIHGDLTGKVCLLVGAGNMGELAARHFVQDGATLWVTNRSHERAEAVANAFGGSARGFADLSLLLEKADVVLTSTAAPGFIVTKDMLKPVMRARRYEPLFFIDISVPRNVDPAVTEHDNVYAYDVDDLSRVVDTNLDKRRAEATRAEAIVLEEVQQMEAWSRSQAVVPTIKAMRARAQSLADAELKRTLAALGDHLSEKDQKSITAMVNAVVGKLLHDPMTALKQSPDGDAELTGAARRLFNLPADDAASENEVDEAARKEAVKEQARAALGAAVDAEAATTSETR